MSIHWWDLAKKVGADSGRLPPGSRVKLRSEHHVAKPVGYEVFELLPKVLHKWRGYKLRSVARFDAVADMDTDRVFPSVYWSKDDWSLPGDKKQTREAEFLPDLILDEKPQEPIWRATIRSSYLFIDERVEHGGGKVAALPSFQGVSLGEVSAEAGRTDTWRARLPTDPRVAVELLQGDRLLAYLDQLSSEFGDASELGDSFLDMLGGAAASYFGGRSIPENGESTERHLGAYEPLWIEVGVPREENLRGAYSLIVSNLDEHTAVTSDPVFLTTVRGRVIRTDLPPELLSEEASDVLEGFAETNFDLYALASERGLAPDEIWRSLVAGTLELGASSVEEAATLVQVGRPRIKELVPA